MLQIYSDFILENQPIDLEDAIEIYRKISGNFGNKENMFKYASPMYAQLVPIKAVKFDKISNF